MHWWTGVIVFPNTNTDVTIELHATPVGSSEMQERTYRRIQSGYHALVESATDYDCEQFTLHEWRLEKIVILPTDIGTYDSSAKTESIASLPVKTHCFSLQPQLKIFNSETVVATMPLKIAMFLRDTQQLERIVIFFGDVCSAR